MSDQEKHDNKRLRKLLISVGVTNTVILSLTALPLDTDEAWATEKNIGKIPQQIKREQRLQSESVTARAVGNILYVTVRGKPDRYVVGVWSRTANAKSLQFVAGTKRKINKSGFVKFIVDLSKFGTNNYYIAVKVADNANFTKDVTITDIVEVDIADRKVPRIASAGGSIDRVIATGNTYPIKFMNLDFIQLPPHSHHSISPESLAPKTIRSVPDQRRKAPSEIKNVPKHDSITPENLPPENIRVLPKGK